MMQRIMFKLYTVLLVLSVCFQASAWPKKVGTKQRAASKAEIKLVREIGARYSNSRTTMMDVEKTVEYMGTGFTKKYVGNCKLATGKLRLEMEGKVDKSKLLIVIDGKMVWIVVPPKKGSKAKTQVTKSALSSPKAKTQGLMQILFGGGVLKYFRVAGVEKTGEELKFHLQPKRQSLEFKRANVVVDVSKKIIKELRFWDTLDNLEQYNFSNIKFNNKFAKNTFVYNPPENADITDY